MPHLGIKTEDEDDDIKANISGPFLTDPYEESEESSESSDDGGTVARTRKIVQQVLKESEAKKIKEKQQRKDENAKRRAENRHKGTAGLPKSVCDVWRGKYGVKDTGRRFSTFRHIRGTLKKGQNVKRESKVWAVHAKKYHGVAVAAAAVGAYRARSALGAATAPVAKNEGEDKRRVVLVEIAPITPIKVEADA